MAYHVLKPMALFKKIYAINKKIASSKFFWLSFVLLILLLALGSIFVFVPAKDIESLLPKVEDFHLDFLSGNKKTKALDPEEQKIEIAISKIFESAKEQPRKTIADLENFHNLPSLLENRKNFVLMNLYQKVHEPALAFIHANKISRDYIPQHSLYKRAMLAKNLGLEAVVVEDLLYLVNKFPKEAKFEYELAKSYSRQNLKEDAKKHFLSIKDVFADSDYALGADYYLASMNADESLAKKQLENYLVKSPSGNLAPLAADQLLANSQMSEFDSKRLGNYIAVAFHRAGQYKKALEHFNVDLNSPELFLKAYAESLNKVNGKSAAINALVKYTPKINDSEKAKELIDYLLSLCTKSQAINSLRGLKDNVLESIRDKILWELVKRTREKQYYVEIYTNYKDSFYAAESMAKVFWQEYKRQSYTKALDLAKKHWEQYSYALSHPYVAFWSGKILLKQGKKTEAYEVFNKIIDEHPHNYYSYRAKQLMNLEKKWYKVPPVNKFIAFPNWNWPEVYSDEEIEKKFGYDSLELVKLKQFDYLLDFEEEKKFDKRFKMFLLANSGNYLKAIRTAYFALGHKAEVNHKDAMFQYAFPLAYADLVFDRAGEKQKVDPILVHSLIRQESFYQKDIVSKVGAVGLMQLMPYTARTLARQMNIRPPRAFDLKKPSMNVSLGVRYMEQVFASFDNNMINAIASYNAGPGAVRKWIKKYDFSDPDLYVESIPYEETRNYVKQVLNNYFIYRDLYS